MANSSARSGSDFPWTALSMADFPQPGLPSDCERAGAALCVVAFHALSESGGSVLTRLLKRSHASSCPRKTSLLPDSFQSGLTLWSTGPEPAFIPSLNNNNGNNSNKWWTETRITHNSCRTGSRKLLKRTG